MKTLEIKDVLKKDLFIVEIPRKGDVEIFPNSIEIYNQFTGQEDTIEGSYTLLGKPDEIKDEDVAEIVQKIEYDFGTCYRHYTDKTVFARTAKESLLSLIESEIYWTNPFKKPDNYNLWAKYGDFTQYGVGLTTDSLRWHEAEQKTFDRNRTLIFVKK